MNPEEESLYAEMRAAIRGDQERAAKRAEQRAAQATPTAPPVPVSEPAASVPDEPQRQSGLRRFFGGRRDPS